MSVTCFSSVYVVVEAAVAVFLLALAEVRPIFFQKFAQIDCQMAILETLEVEVREPSPVNLISEERKISLESHSNTLSLPVKSIKLLVGTCGTS
jgi:hypothetical protein